MSGAAGKRGSGWRKGEGQGARSTEAVASRECGLVAEEGGGGRTGQRQELKSWWEKCAARRGVR